MMLYKGNEYDTKRGAIYREIDSLLLQIISLELEDPKAVADYKEHYGYDITYDRATLVAISRLADHFEAELKMNAEDKIWDKGENIVKNI